MNPSLLFGYALLTLGLLQLMVLAARGPSADWRSLVLICLGVGCMIAGDTLIWTVGEAVR